MLADTRLCEGFLTHGADANVNVDEILTIDLVPFILIPVHKSLLATMSLEVVVSIRSVIAAALHPKPISQDLQRLLDAQGAQSAIKMRQIRCWFGNADEWEHLGTGAPHIQLTVGVPLFPVHGQQADMVTRPCIHCDGLLNC